MDKNEEKEREMKGAKTAKSEEVTLPIAPEHGKQVKETLEMLEKSYAIAGSERHCLT